MLKHIQSNEEWNEKSLGAKGFTLIELLVVIVILGILAAVVVFAVSGIKDKGTRSACKTEAKTVRTAVEAYNAANSGYPADLAALTSSTGAFLDGDPENVTLSGFSATAPPSYAWNAAGPNKCNLVTSPAITP